jgi:hypothetical protein
LHATCTTSMSVGNSGRFSFMFALARRRRAAQPSGVGAFSSRAPRDHGGFFKNAGSAAAMMRSQLKIALAAEHHSPVLEHDLLTFDGARGCEQLDVASSVPIRGRPLSVAIRRQKPPALSQARISDVVACVASAP